MKAATQCVRMAEILVCITFLLTFQLLNETDDETWCKIMVWHLTSHTDSFHGLGKEKAFIKIEICAYSQLRSNEKKQSYTDYIFSHVKGTWEAYSIPHSTSAAQIGPLLELLQHQTLVEKHCPGNVHMIVVPETWCVKKCVKRVEGREVRRWPAIPMNDYSMHVVSVYLIAT